MFLQEALYGRTHPVAVRRLFVDNNCPTALPAGRWDEGALEELDSRHNASTWVWQI